MPIPIGNHFTWCRRAGICISKFASNISSGSHTSTAIAPITEIGQIWRSNAMQPGIEGGRRERHNTWRRSVRGGRGSSSGRGRGRGRDHDRDHDRGYGGIETYSHYLQRRDDLSEELHQVMLQSRQQATQERYQTNILRARERMERQRAMIHESELDDNGYFISLEDTLETEDEKKEEDAVKEEEEDDEDDEDDDEEEEEFVFSTQPHSNIPSSMTEEKQKPMLKSEKCFQSQKLLLFLVESCIDEVLETCKRVKEVREYNQEIMKRKEEWEAAQPVSVPTSKNSIESDKKKKNNPILPKQLTKRLLYVK